MPIFNKLIRDKIPQIMDKDNKTYSLRTLSHDEYVVELKKKLGEELTKYLSASADEEAVEELADLLELIHAITVIHGSSPEQLEDVRKQKAEKRGAFGEKLFLIEVHENDGKR